MSKDPHDPEYDPKEDHDTAWLRLLQAIALALLISGLLTLAGHQW